MFGCFRSDIPVEPCVNKVPKVKAYSNIFDEVDVICMISKSLAVKFKLKSSLSCRPKRIVAVPFFICRLQGALHRSSFHYITGSDEPMR